jgi:hypothetical protein
MIPTVATTVSIRPVRMTCLGCGDVLPLAVTVELNALPYCRFCAHEIMRADIQEMSRQLMAQNVGHFS